jgi:hypothetical protein
MTATYWEFPEAARIGPCRCQGCGEPLWWAEGPDSVMGVPIARHRWREEDGVLHRCPNPPIMMSETGRRRRPQDLRPGPSHS